MYTCMNCFLLTVIAVGYFGVVSPAWGQVIHEDVKLLASDRAFGDGLGGSIAINNGIVAVGAAGDNDNGANSGSAYLFNAYTGTQLAKLLPNDGTEYDNFGASIAFANGVVAVGAFLSGSGSAYLFDAATGAQIHKLLSSDGAMQDRFGMSIAIANGIVAVGAPKDDDNGLSSGSVYLFDVSTGLQIAKLLPNDGAAGDSFGLSVAIDNGIVAVGAYGDDDNGFDSGSAYLFDVLTGVQFAKMLPSDGWGGDMFGWSIAISNNVVAVGAYGDDDNGPDSGSAYLFDASTGNQITKLLPSDGATEDLFGRSIDIDNDVFLNGVVAVGADWDDDNGSASGSVYLFDAFTGTQISKLLPSDGAPNDYFGGSIAIHNGIVATGAWSDSTNAIDSGSAYVFDLNCPADLTGDFELNFFDVSVFLTFFQLNDPLADFTGDGEFNFFDVSAFLAAFSAGCP